MAGEDHVRMARKMHEWTTRNARATPNTMKASLVVMWDLIYNMYSFIYKQHTYLFGPTYLDDRVNIQCKRNQKSPDSANDQMKV